jgi:hypothetical protein
MVATRYKFGDLLWLVADGDGLRESFGLEAGRVKSEADHAAGLVDMLVELHARLAEKEMMWSVVRRRFGIREVTESDPRRMVAQDDKAIAEEMGMHPDAVGDLMKRALSWWKRRGKKTGRQGATMPNAAQQDLPAQAGGMPTNGGKTSQGSSPAPGEGKELADAADMTKGERRAPDVEAQAHANSGTPGTLADPRLRRYGFGGERNPEVMAHLVQRFNEHSDLLESAGDRGTMIKMLGDEVTLLFVVMPRIAKIRAELVKAQEDEGTKAGASDTDADRLKEAQAMADDLQKAIEKSKEALGIGEGEGGALDVAKRIRKNASTLIEAHRLYYAKGDRRAVDGVFDFCELRLLLKAYGDRPAQYRGDLPLIAAQVRERLWDESCDPVGPNRDEQRKIRAAVVRITEAMEVESNGVLEDLVGEDAEPVPQAPALRVGGASAEAASVKGDSLAEPSRAPREREQVFV